MTSLSTTLLIGLLIWIPLWPKRPVVIRLRSFKLPGLSLEPLGLSFLCFVFIREDVYRPSVLAHEFAHFRQQRLYSPLGLCCFMFFDLLRLYAQGKRGVGLYQNLWTEQDANRRMQAPIPHPWIELQLRPFAVKLRNATETP